jgi:hypothetical protein
MFERIGVSRIALCGVALIGLAMSACADESSDEADSVSSPIIGGSADNVDSAVAELYLVNGKTHSLCTGTLVAPTVLLTAAHCVIPASNGAPGPVPSNVTYAAIFGQRGLSLNDAIPANSPRIRYVDWDRRFVNVNDGKPHPHDIAFAFLADPVLVEPPGFVGPVQVPPYTLLATMNRTSSMRGREGQTLRIAGFGETRANDTTTAGSKYNTWTTFAGFSGTTAEPMLVGLGGHTICSGDSGGPAFLRLDGIEKIVGVVSSGDCMSKAHYTEVDAEGAFLDRYFPATPPKLTTDTYKYPAGTTIRVTFGGVTPSPDATHWLALTTASAPVKTYNAWIRPTNTASGSGSFIANVPPRSDYVIRLFANNGYTLLAQSQPFAVYR